MKLKEIAIEANVSISAVSLVRNNKPGVSEKKRQLIEKLLLENGYNIKYDNGDARVIRLLKFVDNGLSVDGNPGFAFKIIDAAEKECRNRGFDFSVTNFSEENIQSTIDMLNENPTFGIILFGSELDSELFEPFQKLNSTIVVLDNLIRNAPCNAVTMNNQDSIYLAVKHLYDLGHRNIGFIQNSIPTNNCVDRRLGFNSALKALNLKFKKENIITVYPSLDGSFEAIDTFIKEGNELPEALVATNDVIALGAIKAFQVNSIRVPEDISIIGFEDISFSSFSEPMLTTISVPCNEMGSLSVMLLQSRIEHPELPNLKVIVNTNLITRNSTAPPREKE